MFNRRQLHRAARKGDHSHTRTLRTMRRVIEVLVFRHVLFNAENATDPRIQYAVRDLIKRAHHGTLPFTIPPGVRLVRELYKAYYELPSRISMALMFDKAFPDKIFEDAKTAARIVKNKEEGIRTLSPQEFLDIYAQQEATKAKSAGRS